MNTRQRRPSRGRVGLIAGLVGVSAILGAAITGFGTAQTTVGVEPITGPVITPDGGPPTFQILTRPRTAEDRITGALPAEVLAGINLKEVRLARRFLGVRVYAAPMLTGRDICVIMLNRPFATPEAALNCAPPEWLATGRQAMKLQGGRGDVAVYAGIVPDGVDSVQVGDASSAVESNVIALVRQSGSLSRRARYRLRNGQERDVIIPVDDSSISPDPGTSGSGSGGSVSSGSGSVSSGSASTIDRGMTPPPD